MTLRNTHITFILSLGLLTTINIGCEKIEKENSVVRYAVEEPLSQEERRFNDTKETYKQEVAIYIQEIEDQIENVEIHLYDHQDELSSKSKNLYREIKTDLIKKRDSLKKRKDEIMFQKEEDWEVFVLETDEINNRVGIEFKKFKININKLSKEEQVAAE